MNFEGRQLLNFQTMNKYFISVGIIFLLIFLNFSLEAQPKTNLDVFKELVDASIVEIFAQADAAQKDIHLDLKLGSSYSIFENQIFKSVHKQSKSISSVYNPSENIKLSYSIENAVVNYGEVFRDGFLGEHFVDRKVFISGSYRLQNGKTAVDNFYYENIDTVKFDEIQNLENPSYPFTKGETPTEPFLSNLFEPLVAITTAAVAIALFFTVRSK